MEHSATPRLILNNMSKHFGTVKAVDDVSLTFMPGEVRGLIGENGSGKSTLSAMICGSYKPTAGTMEFDGAPYHPLSVIDARNKGIAILLQERGTIDGMTVAENIFIGFESRFRGAFGISREKMKKAAQEMLHEIGADHIHPGDLVDAYKFEDRKLVEVARALYTRPEVLIVDETTSALSLSGREAIYRIIRRFKEEGKVVIFIGHDLDEIIAVCDTATVLKDGKFVATLSGEDMNAAKMRSLMIGRENLGHYYREDFVPTYNEERVVLRAEHLTYGKTVRDVSLELHEREILGICGLSDSGMHDLAKALFGALDTESGTVSVPGVTDAVRNPVQAVGAKIAYLPKDRDTESLFLQASIRDNISITCFDQEKPDFSIPAMGCPPRKSKPYCRASGKAVLQTSSLVPPQSNTSVPGAIFAALAVKKSAICCGYSARISTSRSRRRASVSAPCTTPSACAACSTAGSASSA